MITATPPALSHLDVLSANLRALGPILRSERSELVTRVGTLLRHNALAASHHVRRAEKDGSRDNKVMRFGQAVELKSCLDICDVAHCGAQHAGEIILVWQVEGAIALRGRDVTACIDPLDLLREILRDVSKRTYLTELGAYIRWTDLSEKYSADNAAFEASSHGRDLNGVWRKKPASTNQKYMLSRILPLLAADNPDFVSPPVATRGQAYEVIKAAGGNPRFLKPPARPSLPDLP